MKIHPAAQNNWRSGRCYAAPWKPTPLLRFLVTQKCVFKRMQRRPISMQLARRRSLGRRESDGEAPLFRRNPFPIPCLSEKGTDAPCPSTLHTGVDASDARLQGWIQGPWGGLDPWEAGSTIALQYHSTHTQIHRMTHSDTSVRPHSTRVQGRGGGLGRTCASSKLQKKIQEGPTRVRPLGRV